MTSKTTASAYLKALGRLAHHKYSRRRCLSSHAGSWRERGSHDFGYCPIRPSEGSRQTGTFQVFPVVRCLSFQACSWCAPIGRSSTGPNQGSRGASYDPAASNQPISTQSKRTRMRYGKGEAHQKAAAASSTCGSEGAARPKPGRVIVRHFCDWLLCCNEGRPCPRPLSPERSAEKTAPARCGAASARIRDRSLQLRCC